MPLLLFSPGSFEKLRYNEIADLDSDPLKHILIIKLVMNHQVHFQTFNRLKSNKLQIFKSIYLYKGETHIVSSSPNLNQKKIKTEKKLHIQEHGSETEDVSMRAGWDREVTEVLLLFHNIKFLFK